ncbi:MAG: hypothetical protein RLZZ428_742 [Pseudomonadota bacterium]|jgi:hypothetical protein
MKKLILLALMGTYAMSGFTNEAEVQAAQEATENARLCQIFTEKVKTYESTMRGDALAKATLDSYKVRQSKFCNTPSNS